MPRARACDVVMRRRRATAVGSAGPSVNAREQRQRAVDDEPEQRQQRNEPQPLGDGPVERVRCHRRGLQQRDERKHQPLSRLMF